MKSHLAIALLALPLLTACNRPAPAPTSQDPASAGQPAAQPQTALGRTVAKAMDEARTKLATENISLNGDFGVSINGNRVGNHGTENLPKAEITPQGDFLIEGKAVAIDDGERKLVQAYRAGILTIAEAGMALGVQGADLGMRAAGDAIASIFTGNTDAVEKKVEAEAGKLEASALKLCEGLPALLSAQDALAAAVPEFKPYASMDQGDIDDCNRDSKDSQTRRTQIQEDIRTEVRTGIRSGIQGVAQAVGVARSGTGDTVTVDGVRVLLPPGGVSTDSRNGTTTIEVSNGLQVKLASGQLSVNGKQYPAPQADGEVDLSTNGTVKVDGKVVSAI